MYFTEEEKEIIRKIALKERYSINEFFKDNFVNRKIIKISDEWQYVLKDYWTRDRKMDEILISSKSDPFLKQISHIIEIYVFETNHKILLDKYIKVWTWLEKNNYLISKKISKEKIKLNFRNFGKIYNENYNTIDTTQCNDYEDYAFKETIVIQSDLKEFIDNDFKTKDEIRIEEETNARNEALKDAKKSFLVSVIIAFVSIIVSVIPLFKDDKVIIKNQVNTKKLEKQLEETTQELKDIKNKFEKLQTKNNK